MGKPKKKGAYDHFCVAILAQGKWTDKDRAIVRQKLIEKRKEKTDAPYPLFLKLTRQEEKPSYSDCHICGPIYDMFQEIISVNDNIYYHGHHYIIPEGDNEDIKELANIIIKDNKVKKFYLLILDGFGEVNRTDIKQWTLKELKEQITLKKCNISEFEKVIDEDNVKPRIIYEIIKY